MRRTVVAVTVAAALSLVAAPSAAFHAGSTACRFRDGVVTLRLASEHVVRLLVVDGRVEYADLTDYSRTGQCGRATVNNTRRIDITETLAGTSRLQFDQQLGHFGPGRRDESTGASEIEVRLGTLTDIWIMGREAGERITIGQGGVNLNADGDVDLLGTRLDEITIFGFGGDDTISARGGRGTGAAWRGDLLAAAGGDGSDRLIGSSRRDVLDGDAGEDRLEGRGGRDDVDGGTEGDVVAGGRGADTVTGGSWPDTLIGGPGDDVVLASDSGTDSVDGGDGSDQAFIDDVDDVRNVETTSYGDP